MSKQYNYVDCPQCSERDDEWRHSHVCPFCNNTRKARDPKDILCNLCAGPMRHLGTQDDHYPQGLENAIVHGEYNSYHLLDTNAYKFSFCEECLRKLFNQCKIKPDIFESGVAISWEEDQRIYEYRVWQDIGGHHQAYLNRKCNRIKDCPNIALYTVLYDAEFSEDCLCEEHKELFSNNSTITKFIPNILKAFL